MSKRFHISSLQLKTSFRKGFQIYATHMEESAKDKVSNLEDCLVLKEYKDVFWEFVGLPPKRDIYFYIVLIRGATPVSKTPYRMSTPKLKELQM
jgi:hypothetical protein